MIKKKLFSQRIFCFGNLYHGINIKSLSKKFSCKTISKKIDPFKNSINTVTQNIITLKYRDIKLFNESIIYPCDAYWFSSIIAIFLIGGWTQSNAESENDEARKSDVVSEFINGVPVL